MERSLTEERSMYTVGLMKYLRQNSSVEIPTRLQISLLLRLVSSRMRRRVGYYARLSTKFPFEGS
jgi:hypothetical protein